MKLLNSPWPIGEKHTCSRCRAEYEIDKPEDTVVSYVPLEKPLTWDVSARIKCPLCGQTTSLKKPEEKPANEPKAEAKPEPAKEPDKMKATTKTKG